MTITKTTSILGRGDSSLLSSATAASAEMPLRYVISRLGVADVRAFGLTWEDCENLIERLGCRARVEVFA